MSAKNAVIIAKFRIISRLYDEDVKNDTREMATMWMEHAMNMNFVWRRVCPVGASSRKELVMNFSTFTQRGIVLIRKHVPISKKRPEVTRNHCFSFPSMTTEGSGNRDERGQEILA